MKNRRILRITGVAIILALLFTAILVTPAFAVTVNLSPTTQMVGGSVSFTGSGYGTYDDTNYQKYVDIYITDQTNLVSLGANIGSTITRYAIISQGNVEVNGDGTLSGSFTVPSVLNQGTLGLSTPLTLTAGTTVDVIFTTAYQYPFVLGIGESTSVGTFMPLTILQGATISFLDPTTLSALTSVAAGNDVVVSGTNFPVNTPLTFKLDSAAISIKSGATATTTAGTFTTIINIPTTITAGAHTITATAGTGTATATFTITASAAVTLTPTTGAPGSTVVITGSAFPANTLLTFLFGGTAITPAAGSNTVTGSNGAFTSIITVPSDADNGGTIITATAGTTTLTATFTVAGATTTTTTTTPPPTETTTTPPPTETTTTTAPPPSGNSGTSLQLLTSTDAVGASITLIGVSFNANATVLFTWDGTQIATGTANKDGFVSASFTVPSGAAGLHGDHTIKATDGTNSATLTFTVESTAPPIPIPAAPLNGAKIKAPVSFDWGDVADPSLPVTYNLQISTDPNFAADSVMINKTGLKTSNYTLSSDELDKLTANNVIYYWRESATDGAGNQSEWTQPGAFSIQPPFKFNGWPLYVVIGVGALIIFLLGLWVGRRTAFYY